MKTIKELTKIFTGKATTESTTENNIISPEIFGRKQAYDVIMNSGYQVGNKKYSYIPLELLEIDDSYQRVDTIDMSKVYDLVRHYNENKCDPIQVSPHPETGTFAVVNGAHRMMVAEIRNEKGIEAYLMTGLSEDPDERRLLEAEIFVTQDEGIDNLKISQKHKANVKRGIPKYVVLDECLKGRKILINPRLRSNLPEPEQDKYKDHRVLSGYSAALSAAGLVNGKETLTNIFDIIEKTGWHYAASGYSAKVIIVLKSILNLHDNDSEIVNAIHSFLINIEPQEFFAKACAKYPNRKEKERLCLYLEQEISKLLGREPLYTGGDMRLITAGKNCRQYYHSHSATA